ncbi:hypothetical protein SAMN04489751_2626 [Brevibacterium sandarakinum]|uniref:Uncharacterized protein n=1 Tax=Brevibacterium sandarakinum TaxID=629680 RepID=A0A1H1UCC0_BRESA|nr:hypothetical protein SAMN04489751_2626 [Brevibacterium sandarakinum]
MRVWGLMLLETVEGCRLKNGVGPDRSLRALLASGALKRGWGCQSRLVRMHLAQQPSPRSCRRARASGHAPETSRIELASHGHPAHLFLLSGDANGVSRWAEPHKQAGATQNDGCGHVQYLHSQGESAKSSTGENHGFLISRLESVVHVWNGTCGHTLCRRGRWRLLWNPTPLHQGGSKPLWQR